MTDHRTLLLGSGLALLAATAFSVNGPFSVVAYDRGMTTLGVVTWRGAVATVSLAALLGVLMARGRRLRFRELDRRHAVLLVSAGIAGALLNLTIFASLDRMSVALVLITFYTYPAMLALVGIVFLHERITTLRVASLTLAIAGMALVVLGEVDVASGVRLDLLGFALAFVAALCQVVYFTIGRHGFPDLPADEATLGVFATSIAVYAVAGLVGGGLGTALSAPLGDPSLLAIVVLLGTVGAVLPSVLILTAIRRIGGVRTGIILMFEPVIGVALAAALLDQSVFPIQLVGGALVLAGGIIVQVSPERGDQVLTTDEPASTI